MDWTEDVFCIVSIKMTNDTRHFTRNPLTLPSQCTCVGGINIGRGKLPREASSVKRVL